MKIRLKTRLNVLFIILLLIIPLLSSTFGIAHFDLLSNDLHIHKIFINSNLNQIKFRRHKRSDANKRELNHFDSINTTTITTNKSSTNQIPHRNGKMELFVDPFTTLILGKLIGIHYGLVAGKLVTLGSYLKNRCCSSSSSTTSSTISPTEGLLRRINRRRIFSSPLRKEVITEEDSSAVVGHESKKTTPKNRKKLNERRKDERRFSTSTPSTVYKHEKPPFRETNEMEWMDIDQSSHQSRQNEHKRRRRPDP